MGIETKIKRLFVLMLENRSFDNLLGWSDLRGWQPDGTPTQADTLVGKQPYINTSIDAPQRSVQHPIGHGAPFRLNFDPGHEFSDVLVQLCRDAAANIPGSCVKDTLNLDAAGTYPSMSLNPNQLGYAECMQEHGLDIASALTCFTPNQLPVINFLASQFAVCDRWFSSMPGPTLPNRFFALAGTSWGIDYSPSDFSVIDSEFFTGKFGTGSDSLLTRLAPEEWLVAYGDTPLAWTLNGVGDDVHRARFIRQQELINSLKDGHLDDSV
ncbi:MAG TPA: alkaline phosphatase family protein, partial [Noviherbaspirillum sp.]